MNKTIEEDRNSGEISAFSLKDTVSGPREIDIPNHVNPLSANAEKLRDELMKWHSMGDFN